jgi:hypothetical protein
MNLYLFWTSRFWEMLRSGESYVERVDNVVSRHLVQIYEQMRGDTFRVSPCFTINHRDLGVFHGDTIWYNWPWDDDHDDHVGFCTVCKMWCWELRWSKHLGKHFMKTAVVCDCPVVCDCLIAPVAPPLCCACEAIHSTTSWWASQMKSRTRKADRTVPAYDEMDEEVYKQETKEP